MHRPKWCHVCESELTLRMSLSGQPDFWLRLAGEEWLPSLDGPQEGEVAVVSLVYGCATCGTTFRLVVSAFGEERDRGNRQRFK